MKVDADGLRAEISGCWLAYFNANSSVSISVLIEGKEVFGTIASISVRGVQVIFDGVICRPGVRLVGHIRVNDTPLISYCGFVTYVRPWSKVIGVKFHMESDRKNEIQRMIEKLVADGVVCAMFAEHDVIKLVGSMTGRSACALLKCWNVIRPGTLDLRGVHLSDSACIALLVLAHERWGARIAFCEDRINELLRISSLSNKVCVNSKL